MAPRQYIEDAEESSSSNDNDQETRSAKQPTHKDYRIGWICPLEVEQIAASMMLDEDFEPLSQPSSDQNVYTLGRIGKHNVVIAGLPTADNCSAAAVATSMRRTFPRLEFALLVGIGGGVPRTTSNGPIRLGHVVVSQATDQHSGTIQYDHGKAVESDFSANESIYSPQARAMGMVTGQSPGMIGYHQETSRDSQVARRGPQEVSNAVFVNQRSVQQSSGSVQFEQQRTMQDGFIRRGYVEPPPTVLVNAARTLAVSHARSKTDKLLQNLERIDTKRRKLRYFRFPGRSQDRLFRSDYRHLARGQSCEECGCDSSQLVPGRDTEEDEAAEEGQPDEIVVHRGTIATGEKVIGDANLRDQLSQQDNILCFETEAAGALRGLPCLAIRGISDYCDSHKNDAWHGFAAAAAASYARYLFEFIPVHEVDELEKASEQRQTHKRTINSSSSNGSGKKMVYSQYIGTNHGVSVGESTGNINFTVYGPGRGGQGGGGGGGVWH